jgi:hypothetical protein
MICRRKILPGRWLANSAREGPSAGEIANPGFDTAGAGSGLVDEGGLAGTSMGAGDGTIVGRATRGGGADASAGAALTGASAPFDESMATPPL